MPTTIDTQDAKSLSYPSRTVERAKRALVCSGFKLHLFETMREQSVSIGAIALAWGIQNGYTKRPLSDLAVENQLMWLIQVGVLRREVDGQGITDSFRLTPLGRQLVKPYQKTGIGSPSWVDHLYNALSRFWRLPF